MQQTEDGGKTRALRRLELRSIKDSVKFRKQENDQLKKKTAVDELSAKFDLERIGLAAALNQTTDEEIKLRIRGQIAILDNNEALAKKILAEMEAAEAAKKMAEIMAKSAADLEAAFQATIARLMIFDPLKSLRPTTADLILTGATNGKGGGGGGGGGTKFPPAITPYDPLSSLTVTT